MKKLLPTCLFLFYAQVAFLQIYDLETLPNGSDIPGEFMYIYPEEQVAKIVEYARSFDKREVYERAATEKIFAYMRSLLTDEQKELVWEKKGEQVEMFMGFDEQNSGILYTEAQKQAAKAYYRTLPDSLLMWPKHDQFRKHLETLHNADQRKIIAEKHRADSIALNQQVRNDLKENPDYVQKAKREKEKFDLYLKHYVPACEKLHNQLVASLTPEDRQLLDSLKEFYYAKLEQLRQQKLANCLDEKGNIEAPHAHAFFSAQFDIVKIAPFLCIFWCPQYGNFEVNTSHLDFARKMEYLTLKYKTTLEPLQEEKLRYRQQVREKIEGLKTPEERQRDKERANGPTLTITHSGEFSESSDYGDLWLFDLKRIP